MKSSVAGFILMWLAAGSVSGLTNQNECTENLRIYQEKYGGYIGDGKRPNSERLAYIESIASDSCINNAFYLIFKSELLIQLGKIEDALRLLEEADKRKLEPRTFVLEKKASTLLLLKKHDVYNANYSLDDINALLLEALEIESKETDKSAIPMLYFRMARVSYLKNNFDEAGILLTKAISLGENLPAEYYNFGVVIASKQNDWNTAAKLFEIGLQKSKNDYLDSDETLRAIAETYCQLGRNDLASKAISLALTDNPVFAHSKDIQVAQNLVRECPVVTKKTERQPE